MKKLLKIALILLGASISISQARSISFGEPDLETPALKKELSLKVKKIRAAEKFFYENTAAVRRGPTKFLKQPSAYLTAKYQEYLDYVGKVASEAEKGRHNPALLRALEDVGMSLYYNAIQYREKLVNPIVPDAPYTADDATYEAYIKKKLALYSDLYKRASALKRFAWDMREAAKSGLEVYYGISKPPIELAW
ncbi:hypothetical protein B0187_04645 [Haemophilus paracuniculus]|uniref:Uncharacterized protein n=1 Tax=Haemophilus paracuniculus TaxID=734 RepID=A0A1T0AT47_9PAST|nr:hypothetical protein [Haemophilus paracuniculus]OOR99605.1 hypothetical protein B0187_04645 [Haemophilus paracuniculus]